MQHSLSRSLPKGAVCLRQQQAWPASLRPSVRRHAQQTRRLTSVLTLSQGSDGSSIAPTGQISSALIDSMTGNIREALEAQKVQVIDVYGDGRHVSIDVVSEMFDGKSAMQRQRMVYKAIWVELQEAVHAVDSMSTMTPTEAGL